MNPIGNVYPIGAYAAEFREDATPQKRKGMLQRTKNAISRALKNRKKRKRRDKIVNTMLAASPVVLGLAGLAVTNARYATTDRINEQNASDRRRSMDARIRGYEQRKERNISEANRKARERRSDQEYRAFMDKNKDDIRAVRQRYNL
jgi:hypothetical protein